MAEIVFKGRTLFLDELDFSLLRAHAWSWTKQGYLVSKVASGKGRRTTISFHRMIMGNPEGFWVDHINRNPLDCRRLNLRLCSPYDNARNRKHWKADPGVTWNPGRQKWQVVIRDGGKPKWFGYFDDEAKAVDAAKAARSGIKSIICPL